MGLSASGCHFVQERGLWAEHGVRLVEDPGELEARVGGVADVGHSHLPAVRERD